jgi:hypothetical protein
MMVVVVWKQLVKDNSYKHEGIRTTNVKAIGLRWSFVLLKYYLGG